MSRDSANTIWGYERFKIQAQCFTWENGRRSMVWKEKWERFLRVQQLSLIHMYIVNMKKTVLPQAVESAQEDKLHASCRRLLYRTSERSTPAGGNRSKQARKSTGCGTETVHTQHSSSPSYRRNFKSWHFHLKQIKKIRSWIQELKRRAFESKEIIEDATR